MAAIFPRHLPCAAKFGFCAKKGGIYLYGTFLVGRIRPMHQIRDIRLQNVSALMNVSLFFQFWPNGKYEYPRELSSSWRTFPSRGAVCFQCPMLSFQTQFRFIITCIAQMMLFFRWSWYFRTCNEIIPFIKNFYFYLFPFASWRSQFSFSHVSNSCAWPRLSSPFLHLIWDVFENANFNNNSTSREQWICNLNWYFPV